MLIKEPLYIGWGVLWYRSKHHGFESRKDRDKRVEVDRSEQSEDPGGVSSSIQPQTGQLNYVGL